MTEQQDLAATETRLRAHYADHDPGPLPREARDRIRDSLRASSASNAAGSGSPRRLDPVRPSPPTGRAAIGWPLAVAAAVALLAVTLVAVDRLASTPAAASPAALPSSAPSSSAGGPSPSQSTVPSPAGSTSNQRAIAFSDRRHGIVVGAFQGQGAVWTTADGGQTWTSTLVPTGPLDSVAVLGSRAWASAGCDGAGASCTPTVIASEDGGATWTAVGSAAVASLTFTDPQHGWGVSPAASGAARLLGTADGGRTWTFAGATPCETGFLPVAASFPDAAHGWIACGSGRFAAGSSPKEVVATADGGTTWTVRSRADGGVSAPESLPFAGTFRGLQMLADGTGVAWLWNEGLVRTADGGATWTRLPLGQETSSLQWPGAAVTGDGGLFALTLDANSGDGSATFNLGFADGRIWKPYGAFARLPAPGTTPTPGPTPPPQPPIADSGVAFFDTLHGIAIGNGPDRAYLWRTSDGGATWTTTALDAASARLMATSADRVWISTSSCAANPPDPQACTPGLDRSDDRGATWRVVGHQGFGSVSFGDATHGFGVGPLARPPAGDALGGGGGGIYATSDGGVSWTPLADPYPCARQAPVSVSFVSAVHGWVGCSGAEGAGQGMKSVMETGDGGRTWTWRSRVDVPGGPAGIGSIPSSDYLATIAMQPDGAGFMTGGRFSTFRTADGGRTWTSCPPGSFDAYPTSQAAVVPGGPWFVIQSGWITPGDTVMEARLMRSDDQGAHWAQVGAILPSP